MKLLTEKTRRVVDREQWKRDLENLVPGVVFQRAKTYRDLHPRVNVKFGENLWECRLDQDTPTAVAKVLRRGW